MRNVAFARSGSALRRTGSRLGQRASTASLIPHSLSLPRRAPSSPLGDFARREPGLSKEAQLRGLSSLTLSAAGCAATAAAESLDRELDSSLALALAAHTSPFALALLRDRCGLPHREPPPLDYFAEAFRDAAKPRPPLGDFARREPGPITRHATYAV